MTVAQIETQFDPMEDFLPQTEFARELWELRLQIEAKGGDFLDWEGLEREVAERRAWPQRLQRVRQSL